MGESGSHPGLPGQPGRRAAIFLPQISLIRPVSSDSLGTLRWIFWTDRGSMANRWASIFAASPDLQCGFGGLADLKNVVEAYLGLPREELCKKGNE